MKRLDEILSKYREIATSAEPSATSSATAEADDGACPVCGGAGFVRVQRALDDPNFGKAEPCACVLVETESTRQTRLERISNLGSLTRFTFETLVAAGRDGESRWFERAAHAAEAFAADPQGWLVITGPSGSGKTHLAAAVANRCIASGRPALFMVVPDLLDLLRSGYQPAEDDLTFDQVFEQVRNAPLLFLDDIDVPAGTAWAKEKLFQVVNHRYNTQLPTVFTCTSKPAALDERLATRLLDERLALVLPLEGALKAPYEQVGGMTRERLAEMSFRAFDPRGQGMKAEERDHLEAAFRAAMAFAEQPRGWFTLMGTSGTGKTHLAASIANRALNDGMAVFYAVVPDLLDHLRASFAPGKEAGYDEVFDGVRNAALLVLDDLGAQAPSPWAAEKLYQIVNYRTLSSLPTVVTTQLTMDELSLAHPRVLTRIADTHDGSVINLRGPHYRLGYLPEQGKSATGSPSGRGRGSGARSRS